MPRDVLLSERLRVRETIERYFFGVDAQDEGALISCFTDDASAEYHVMTPEHKIVSGGLAIARDVYASCSQFTSSNHSVSTFVVDITSDVANSNTFAVAHVIVRGKALLRGLRYQDRLVRHTWTDGVSPGVCTLPCGRSKPTCCRQPLLKPCQSANSQGTT